MSSGFEPKEIQRILRTMLISRELDLFEEQNLFPKEIPYQFSAKGHELSQAVLGALLTHKKDGVATYYRGRPLLLALGLSIEQAFAASLASAESYSAGRDIGVVANLVSRGAASVLPTAGDVGSQYTPACGWAHALSYTEKQLADTTTKSAIAVAHGGDGSVASNGFWAALNIATTRSLPILFCIEDNGYAISVPSTLQVPGGNIAVNLGSYGNLKRWDVDGTDFLETSSALRESVAFVRSARKPALVRLSVCRLAGHSGQDTQRYKNESTIQDELLRDPIEKTRRFLQISEDEFSKLREEIRKEVESAFQAAATHAPPKEPFTHVYGPALSIDTKEEALRSEPNSPPHTEARINFVDGIRKTLQSEMRRNPKVLLLGEDIADKGGVHAATLGLRTEFGEGRVVDTSLSEEGIIGSSVGLALAGLRPIAEIQFRKYADAATEQLINCGTIRWRTAGAYSAPLVVRMPVGVARKVGDPWHSVSSEAVWAHQIGWHIAMPSRLEDAVGLLRMALRGENPVLFFEHRALLDAEYSRGQYPGDSHMLEFGRARTLRSGSKATVVTWGMMVERCDEAIKQLGVDVELIDLRTIQPWDADTVISSVRKTGRLLVVHEDWLTAGFGAEIVACIAKECLFDLDAPILRHAVADIPIPYNRALTEQVVPSVESIKTEVSTLLAW